MRDNAQIDVDPENQMCAGDGESLADSCKGDSGGPMVVWHSKTQVYYQVGIVSLGHGCALQNVYGIYTRLPKMVGWINETCSCIPV